MSITKFLVPVVIIMGIILSMQLSGVFEVKPASVPLQSSVLPPAIDKTPPAISNVNISNITDSSATITWITDEPATSQVKYGITNLYGSTSGKYDNFVTIHSVVLSDLYPDQTYHYLVRAADRNGNESVNIADSTFRTGQIPGFTTHTDSANGFSISYPLGWNVDKNAKNHPPLVVGFFSPVYCDGLRTSVLLGSGRVHDYKTYCDTIIPRFKEAFPGYIPVSTKEIVIRGLTAIEHVCEHNSFENDNMRMRLLIFYLVGSEKAWYIFCETPNTCWDKYKPDFDNIIRSFRTLP